MKPLNVTHTLSPTQSPVYGMVLQACSGDIHTQAVPQGLFTRLVFLSWVLYSHAQPPTFLITSSCFTSFSSDQDKTTPSLLWLIIGLGTLSIRKGIFNTGQNNTTDRRFTLL